jgi:hypothetical protein
MRKSVIWIPVLLVGAMVYWTLALGFGGLSLMTMTVFQDSDSSDPFDSAAGVKDSYQSITVNLSHGPNSAEGAEPAAATQEPCPTVPLTVDLIPDHESGAGKARGQRQGQGDEGGEGNRGGARRPDPGPGATAF